MRLKSSPQTGRLFIRGFTLIELLVVVSIIALLIAITLPSLGKAKAKAHEVQCGTKMFNLGHAMWEYLSEYDNFFPINGLLMPKMNVPKIYLSNPKFANAAVTDPNKWRLEYGVLWTEMGGPAPVPDSTGLLPATNPLLARNFICIDDNLDRPVNQKTDIGNGVLTLQVLTPGANPTVVWGPPGYPGYWSYSVNGVLNSLGRVRDNFFPSAPPWSDPMKLISIKRPSDFYAFLEEDNGSLFNDEVFDPPAYNGGDILTDRHNGNGNVCHADNSVEPINAAQFNYPPPADPADPNPNAIAMLSPYTRNFFPDGGDFASAP